jgi:hypothetical protein
MVLAASTHWAAKHTCQHFHINAAASITYNVLSIISSISVHNFHFYIWTMLNSRHKMPTAATIKNTVFWDVTYCSPTEINWCFRETHYFHLHGRKVNTQCHIPNSSNLTLMFHSITTFAWFEVMPHHVCSLTKTYSLKHLYNTCWELASNWTHAERMKKILRALSRTECDNRIHLTTYMDILFCEFIISSLKQDNNHIRHKQN